MTSAYDPRESIQSANAALKSLRVPYGLIGGWAVIAWGRVRATRDVDWLAVIRPSRKQEVLEALSPLGAAEWRDPGEDDPIAGLVRVIPEDEERPIIDILLAGKAADRDALSRCVELDLGKGPIPAVRPEDIIAMKLQAGGGLDFEDARAILQVQGHRIDQAVLELACASRRVLERLAALRR